MWLEEQGQQIGLDAPSLSVLRARGSAYIDATYGARFVGVPASIDQADQWPRSGAVVHGRAVPDDLVPLAVVHASYRAALAEGQGVSLSRTFDPTTVQVKRERVDVVEQEYFAAPTDAASAAPVVAGIDGMLAPFLKPDNVRGIGMWVV